MKVKVVFLVLLWVLFSAFGIVLFEKTLTVDDHGQGFVSVAGLDGDVYLRRYCNIQPMFRMRKRHPSEMIVVASAYIIDSSIAEKAGEKPAKNVLVVLAWNVIRLGGALS